MITPDISIGSLITLAIMLFALYKFHVANVKRFQLIQHRVTLMWSSFKKKFDMDDSELEENNDE
jgi:hypothetical protein